MLQAVAGSGRPLQLAAVEAPGGLPGHWQLAPRRELHGRVTWYWCGTSWLALQAFRCLTPMPPVPEPPGAALEGLLLPFSAALPPRPMPVCSKVEPRPGCGAFGSHIISGA